MTSIDQRRDAIYGGVPWKNLTAMWNQMKKGKKGTLIRAIITLNVIIRTRLWVVIWAWMSRDNKKAAGMPLYHRIKGSVLPTHCLFFSAISKGSQRSQGCFGLHHQVAQFPACNDRVYITRSANFLSPKRMGRISASIQIIKDSEKDPMIHTHSRMDNVRS